MVRKSRSRRESRPRLSEAQLEAYRTSRVSAGAEASVRDTAAMAEPTSGTSAWGRLEEEYSMIQADLTRLLIITGLMFGILAVLWFVLG